VNVRQQLIKLAAEIVQGTNMPSEFYEDWVFCKTTPQIDRGKAVCSAKRARQQCREWAITLRKIADGII